MWRWLQYKEKHNRYKFARRNEKEGGMGGNGRGEEGGGPEEGEEDVVLVGELDAEELHGVDDDDRRPGPSAGDHNTHGPAALVNQTPIRSNRGGGAAPGDEEISTGWRKSAGGASPPPKHMSPYEPRGKPVKKESRRLARLRAGSPTRC